MNKVLRWSLIFVTSSLLLTSVALASFMVNVVANEEAEVIDNTYDIVCHYLNETTNTESTIRLEDVEEDSTFDLPILDYSTKDFKGWSLSAERNSTFDTFKNNSVKAIKTNFPNITIENKELNIYAFVENVDENTVLLEIDDQSTANNHQTYYMKTAAKVFNVFNIRYTYPSTFVHITFLYNDGSQDRKTINETVDFSDKGGQTIKAIVTKD